MKGFLIILTFLSYQFNLVSQWTKCQTLVSETLYSVYADTTGLVLVGGSDGVLLKSVDFGNNLRVVKTNFTSVIEKVIKINDSLFFAQISKTLFYSTDMGESWINNLSPNFNINQFQYVNGILYVQPWYYNGSPNDIYKSTDVGKTWKLASKIPTTIGIGKIFIVNDSCWYAIGGQGLLMFTDDYGVNWEKHARGMTNGGFQDIIKVNDTIAITDGPSIFATPYKKDSLVSVKLNNWYPGGGICYSGLYWYNFSQLGVDYSSSIYSWEEKKPSMPPTSMGSYNPIIWIDKPGFGFALYANNLYKTTNHGVNILSLHDNFDNYLNDKRSHDEVEYYNMLGQKVNPINNQLLLKINKQKGNVEKVIIHE